MLRSVLRDGIVVRERAEGGESRDAGEVSVGSETPRSSRVLPSTEPATRPDSDLG